MNSAKKIESSNYPPLRRRGDRARAITMTIEQVKRVNAARMRRMTLILLGSALLLVLNALVITLQA